LSSTLTELVDRAAVGPAYQDLVGEVTASTDPIARLRMAPRIVRQVYDAERSEFDLLRKAGVVMTELAAIENDVGPENSVPEAERDRLTRYLDGCTTI
jgi:hypothetical protein